MRRAHDFDSASCFWFIYMFISGPFPSINRAICFAAISMFLGIFFVLPPAVYQ